MFMRELIKVTKGEINGEKCFTVNARDLWKCLESKQKFADWIKNRIAKYEFIEGVDYLLHNFTKQVPSGKKHLTEYALTLDMAKELGMIENNDQGRRVRLYFLEIEKKYNSQSVCNLKYEWVKKFYNYRIRDTNVKRARQLKVGCEDFMNSITPQDIELLDLYEKKFKELKDLKEILIKKHHGWGLFLPREKQPWELSRDEEELEKEKEVRKKLTAI